MLVFEGQEGRYLSLDRDWQLLGSYGNFLLLSQFRGFCSANQDVAGLDVAMHKSQTVEVSHSL